MSFRFQKRVRVAPGVRLNFSKRGISTSVGRRGASVTAGRRGLYGNTGIPGTGLSYRSKINKKSHSSSKKRHSTKSSKTNEQHQPIEVLWDDSLQDVRFEKSNGQALTDQEEKQVRRQYKKQLIKIYEDKAAEINEKTNRLLDLHHHLFPPIDSLSTNAIDSIEMSLREPNKSTIFQNIYEEKKKSLSIFEKLKLLFPGPRNKFSSSIDNEALAIYNEQLHEYTEEKNAVEEEKENRLTMANNVAEGQVEAMEEWVGLFLDELDFPLETDVDFQVRSSDVAYVDIDLPKLEEVPIKKAEILKSGKLKIQDKTQRDHREHYALMVGGSALYLASFFFRFLPTLQTITLSGYNQIVDPSTGHDEDQYIYSLIIDKKTLYSLHTERVHPIAAFDQFKPKINATKTYMFKEIVPYD
ncbi:DUF4236 domain-containing protein [Salipaludibacillus daqingensis]|uniref:DUF4236 domain-containing protein n=1 Tax=Salipaludibacillus daqingensis TaxID=3041001 RepID=UPI002476EEAA|nr:DUF4236 domain-containing protein [Salipaludibacillus daqingensis]